MTTRPSVHMLSCLVMGGTLYLAPGLARAQSLADLDQEAQRLLSQHLASAQQAYDEGDFEKALRAYQEAYAIYQDVDILYQIALCQERLGQYNEAIEAYETYLARVPNDPERARIEGVIRSLEARKPQPNALLNFRISPAQATLFIDEAQRLEPVDEEGHLQVEIPAGTHEIVLSSPGYVSQRYTVEVNASQTYPMLLSLSRVPDLPPSRSRKVLPYTLLGVGVVGLGAGLSQFAAARSTNASLHDIYQARDQQPRPVGFDAAVKRQEAQWTRGLIFSLSGLLVTTSGGLWLWRSHRRDAPQRDASQEVSISFRGTGLTLTSSF